MKKKFIGRFDIHTPNGGRESFQVRPTNNSHFPTAKKAEQAAIRAGHVKLQSNKYPIGSKAVKFSEEVNVLSHKAIGNSFSGMKCLTCRGNGCALCNYKGHY